MNTIVDFLTDLDPIIQGIVIGIFSIIILIILLGIFLNPTSRKNLRKSIGAVGYVSSPIPKNGVGKIIVTVSGYSFSVPATCSVENLSVQTKVTVKDLTDKTFIVERIKYPKDSK